MYTRCSNTLDGTMKNDKALALATTAGMVLGIGFFFISKKRIKTLIQRNTTTPENSELINNFEPFKGWHATVKENLLNDGNRLEKIRVIEEYKFGNKLGFLIMDVKLNYEEKYIPGFVILRGPSCAVLMWYEVLGETYVLMVRQPRLATGKLVWEVPAGMLDGETDNIKGKMMNEIEEETGIIPQKEKLVYLGTSYSSCGITDEKYIFFSMEIDPKCVLDLNPENLGVDDEIIKNIQVFNIRKAPQEDVKFLALKCLFLDAKSIGRY